MSLVEAAGRSRPIAHGGSLILMDWILPLAGKSIRLLVMIRLTSPLTFCHASIIFYEGHIAYL